MHLIGCYLEYIVCEGVPSVEDRVSHSSGGVSHDAEGLQMPGIRVVGEGDGDVTKVVEVSVQVPVRRNDG